ncbi:MAG: hypothetical protein MMC33_009950 [Icmadophila ericetorum]|nr:hypothetical protein [Icmadophila ericetorum]
MSRATLVKPPPIDPSKSHIENVLELTALRDIGPDIFTNTRPLWHPPGARGIYGGAAIAQSLAAAQKTIPPPNPANGQATYLVHSMHCYFVLAGDASIPILYHVERVREGKSFMTRTVQARQRGKCIFTTTLSFVREGSAGEKTIDHEMPLPEGVREELKRHLAEAEAEMNAEDGDDVKAENDVDEPVTVKKEKEAYGEEGSGPFLSKRLPIVNSTSTEIHTKKTRQWIKARGRISPSSGHEAHLSALAYMSDSYFIGTISRVHNLWRFGSPNVPPPPSSSSPNPIPAALHPMAALESLENNPHPEASYRPRVGMMVSLDHTIFFHRPREVRADEWMFSEMESPWAGDGRGLVLQKIWGRGGRLVATCVQEGLVRLQQDNKGRITEKLVKL